MPAGKANMALRRDATIVVDGVNMGVNTFDVSERANKAKAPRNKDGGKSRHFYDSLEIGGRFEAPWDLDDPPPVLSAGSFYPCTITYQFKTYQGIIGIDEMTAPGGDGGAQQQNGTFTFSGDVTIT